jgi:TetR/AcrR family transcriptional regulator, regulator of autoinduction and epiphytic fitness
MDTGGPMSDAARETSPSDVGPVLDGPVLDGPVLDGPVLDGPVLDGPVLDGRTLRGQRTRRAIIAAHLDLLYEGDLRPTGERIARRAGVSLRALWTNFSDLEALFAASGRKAWEMRNEVYEPVPVGLPLPERVDAFCRQRVKILELIAPAARAVQIRVPFSPELKRSRGQHNEAVRTEIETLFAGELAAFGSERDDIVLALLNATTWPAWMSLRDDLDCDAAVGLRVMRTAVTALLRPQ